MFDKVLDTLLIHAKEARAQICQKLKKEGQGFKVKCQFQQSNHPLKLKKEGQGFKVKCQFQQRNHPPWNLQWKVALNALLLWSLFTLNLFYVNIRWWFNSWEMFYYAKKTVIWKCFWKNMALCRFLQQLVKFKRAKKFSSIIGRLTMSLGYSTLSSSSNLTH